jgi:hypothetical protein
MVEAGWITPAVGRSENNVQGHKLAGEETKLLATQRQLTYLVASASSLRRLYFVVLRLMYVMDIEELNAVSLLSRRLLGSSPSSFIPTAKAYYFSARL